MSKKVSDKQKKEISDLFVKGSSIKDISNIYKFSIQTITRQLKVSLGDDEFKIGKAKIKKIKTTSGYIKTNIIINEDLRRYELFN